MLHEEILEQFLIHISNNSAIVKTVMVAMVMAV